jgi:hypothetical protein
LVYIVEGSADRRTWSVLSDCRKTEDLSQVQKLKFAATGIRYVRITVSGVFADPVIWASIVRSRSGKPDAELEQRVLPPG